MSLAQTYGLDTDLVYQRQWRKSAVNIASIQNYLVCLHSLITCSESHSSSPGGLDGKESACNAGELGSISGLGRSPEEGKVRTYRTISWL